VLPASPNGVGGIAIGAPGVDIDGRLLTVGASMGGIQAVRALVCALPADSPGVVISQHIPAGFSAAFARRLDHHGALTVREARDGETILRGHAYVAPGGRHLEVRRWREGYRCHVHDAPAVDHHRPSVDLLFRSVAAVAGPEAVGVLLTGMGTDGARGLLEMRAAGAHTICQDQASSAVWGMPGAAVRLGAACQVLALERIAAQAVDYLRAGQRPAR
jgi:two-component system chemotaxis response regulator CheB